MGNNMPALLKIENVGVCPPEGFTVLGVSLADTTNNEGVNGQFGSGNKHGVGVCLRAGLAPIVFAGALRRLVVKYGGSDPITGASRSSTEDLAGRRDGDIQRRPASGSQAASDDSGWSQTDSSVKRQ
jgi:hypothetical protein